VVDPEFGRDGEGLTGDAPDGARQLTQRVVVTDEILSEPEAVVSVPDAPVMAALHPPLNVGAGVCLPDLVDGREVAWLHREMQPRFVAAAYPVGDGFG
jgi:hypothetical protein